MAVRNVIKTLLATILTLSACATAAASPPVTMRPPTPAELGRLEDALGPFTTWVSASRECPIRISVQTLQAINAAVGSVSLPGCPHTVQLMVTEGTLALSRKGTNVAPTR